MVQVLVIIDNSLILKNIFLISVFFIGGVILSYTLWQITLKRKRNSIIKEAEIEAEVIKKDKILQAKEKFLQLKAEHEKYINEKNIRLVNSETKLKQKEANEPGRDQQQTNFVAGFHAGVG